MKTISIFVSALIFFCSLVFSSCSQSCSLSERTVDSSKSSIKILNWNLQTFFDGTYDGNEYSEFTGSSSGWNQGKYEARLDRLIEVIEKVDPDVIVMEELEKQEQLHDIFNRVCSSFDFSRNYSYGCFSKEENSSIGCGVLSRFPLSDVTVHGLDIRSVSDSQPSMRPVMKLFVTVKDKKLELLVNHWKSKSGGETESEVWRDCQEAVLARCFMEAEEEQIPVVACGDFNRNISEFKRVFGRKIQANIELRGDSDVRVYSPWYDSGGNILSEGTYFYNNQWERIDHFFGGKDVTLENFKVETKGGWASSDGYPLKYIVKYGTGYSDHFPISCTVTW